MKHSPLQLERYFFSKIELNAHSTADLQAAHKLNCGVEIGEAVDNPQRFQITLKLQISGSENAQICYTGEFHAVGFFRVLDGWPQRKKMQLVSTNGPAMLYGALREMIFTLTSRGPWPPVTLESVTFLDSSEERSETKKGVAHKEPRTTRRRSQKNEISVPY